MCAGCEEMYRRADHELITKMEEHRSEFMELALKLFPIFKDHMFAKMNASEHTPPDAQLAQNMMLGLLSYYVGTRSPSAMEVEFCSNMAQYYLNLGHAFMNRGKKHNH